VTIRLQLTCPSPPGRELGFSKRQWSNNLAQLARVAKLADARDLKTHIHSL